MYLEPLTQMSHLKPVPHFVKGFLCKNLASIKIKIRNNQCHIEQHALLSFFYFFCVDGDHDNQTNKVKYGYW